MYLKYFLACETSRDKKKTQWNSLLLKFLRFCGKTKRSLIIPSIFGGNIYFRCNTRLLHILENVKGKQD